jgi:hypothetical protein
MTCKKTSSIAFSILLNPTFAKLQKGQFRFITQSNPFVAALIWLDKAKAPICFMTNLIVPHLKIWTTSKNMGKKSNNSVEIPKIAYIYRKYYHSVGKKLLICILKI